MTRRERAHPDPHAAERERKRRKARYGMRVSGASTRLLARLSHTKKPARRAKRVK